MRPHLALLLLLLGSQTAMAEPRIERIDSLIGAYFRPEIQYPLVVQVHGGQAGFEGALELNWGRATLRRSVTLGPGAARRYWFYPIARRAELKARVSLRRNGTQIASQQWRQVGRKIWPIDRLVGVLGPGPGQLGYLQQLTNPLDQGDLHVVEIRNLPDRAAGLAAFDLLIVATNAGKLDPSKAQARALADWFALGGGLIVSNLPAGRLAWIEPLLGSAPVNLRDWPLEEPTSSWFEKWLTEFMHGCGRGLLCRENLLHSKLPGEGSKRLWALIEHRLLDGHRRPTSPGGELDAGRFYPPAGHELNIPRLAHRLIWGLLGILLFSLTLAISLAQRPRLWAVTVTCALSATGSYYIVAHHVPAGRVCVQSIGLLELATDQHAGALQRWIRLSALRPVSATVRLPDGEPPRLLGGGPSTLVADDQSWTVPLSLKRGASRLLATTEPYGGVGPLRLTRPSGLATHLLNASRRNSLRAVAVTMDGSWRLLGDLEPGGALSLDPSRGQRVTLEELAETLFPESPNPSRTLRFLLAARRLESKRVVVARVDLPGQDIAGPALLPSRTTPTLIVVPWR